MHILIADDDPVPARCWCGRSSTGATKSKSSATASRPCGRLISPARRLLAILDWGMPGLEGPEVCRQVRAAALRMQPYLVMLTARHAPEDLAVALEAGADDFLSKPFNRVELMARLHAGMRILNLHRALTDRIQELEESRQREQHLRTLTPICSYCKKIRGDKDDWEPIDQYLAEHGYRFTHAVCPSCLDTVVDPAADAARLAAPPPARQPVGSNTFVKIVRPSRSCRVTVAARVVGSIATCPKNCRLSLGGRFGFGATDVNTASGPKVASRTPGPKVPAWSGPATNSQNGSKSVQVARDGS